MERIKQLNKKQIIGVAGIILATFLFIMIAVYAESDVKVDVIEDENGNETLTFKLDHNVTTAKYKYYGYGYTVTIYSPEGKEIGYKYMDNSEFDSNSTLVNGVETVKIKAKDLFDKLGVAEEYYNRVGCTGRLNGRLGIKVDGVLTHLYDTLEGKPGEGLHKEIEHGTINRYEGQTVPLNKDDKGIKEGLPHEYGVRWTGITEKNLEQHFGIKFIFNKAAIPQDQYKVNYVEIGKETKVAPEKKQEIIEGTTKTEYPVGANGYIYAGKYKIEKTGSTGILTPGTVTEGQSATVTQKHNADIYTITFYYDKIDYGTGGNPDAKVFTAEISYKENSIVGKDLAPKETMPIKAFDTVNVSSKKIDSGSDDFEWAYKGCVVIGKDGQEYFDGLTNLSVIVSKYGYTTPKDDILKFYFLYEKLQLPKAPKCEPEAFGESEDINITMKKKDFDAATEINVTGTFKLDEFRYGKDKDGNKVEGTHGFKCFDLYVKPGNGDKTSFDNKSKTISLNFNVPKSKFYKQTEEKYRAYVDALYVGLCKCNNIGMDDNGISINIILEINKPPVALFDYYTTRTHTNGTTSKVYDKAYVGQILTIINQAYDPNGYQDIKYIKYILIDPTGNQYYVKLYMMTDGTYILNSNDISAKNIEFAGADDDGNINIIFKTSEQWTVKEYVEDQEGLNDIYTEKITPEELDLRPIAILSDEITYRYPDYSIQFTGKQNRVVAINSATSTVAEFLVNTGVEINHARDSVEIIALDGQSLDSIKFAKNITTYLEGNVIKLYYIPIEENFKIMFKEVGRYKVRLQVTDTKGNVSEWTEETFTIYEDKPPTVIATIPEKEYRDASGNAEIKISKVITHSPDGDEVEIEYIKCRYDSNNNGNFEDESYIEIKDLGLKTSNLGKYELIITVKEKFGQETLNQYITDKDYKRGTTTIYTEIDNISPIIKEFKIKTTQ